MKGEMGKTGEMGMTEEMAKKGKTPTKYQLLLPKLIPAF